MVFAIVDVEASGRVIHKMVIRGAVGVVMCYCFCRHYSLSSTCQYVNSLSVVSDNFLASDLSKIGDVARRHMT